MPIESYGGKPLGVNPPSPLAITMVKIFCKDIHLLRQGPVRGLQKIKVLSSKLDWFLSTIDVLWEKITALIEFA